MAVDPNISLDIKTPENPIVLAGQMAQGATQVSTMQARQAAGQIIASAPDLETGLARASQNPQVAAYAGDVINTYRQMMLAQTQQAGEVQKQFMDGYDRMNKIFGSFPTQPGKAQEMMPGLFAGFSPQVRDRMINAYKSANMALVTDNRGNYLPTDPNTGELTPEGAATYFQNSAGMAAAAGMTPDSFSLGGGKPGQVDVGTGMQGVRTMPSGQIIKMGDAVPYGIKPTVTPEGFVQPGVRPEDMPGRTGGATGTPGAPGTPDQTQPAPTYRTATGERQLGVPGNPTPEQMLDIADRENAKRQNIESAPDPKTGKKSSASGYFQMTDDTWREGAKAAGIDINKYPRAIDDPDFTDQYRAAVEVYKRHGEAPWVSSVGNSRLPIPGPRGGGPAGQAGTQAQPAAVTSQPPAAAPPAQAGAPGAQPAPAVTPTQTPTVPQAPGTTTGTPTQAPGTTPTPTPAPAAPPQRAQPAAAPPTATAPTPVSADPATRPKWLQDRIPPGVPPAPAPAALSGPQTGSPVNATSVSGVPDQIAGDGKALWTDQTPFRGLPKSPTATYDAAGNPIMKFRTPQLADSEKAATDKWKGDTSGFDSAQTSLGDLRVMRNDLDNMMSKGYFSPGAGAETRVEFAKYANTAAQMLGLDPPFDPKVGASAEQFIKKMNEMGVAMGRSMLGGQREAAQTIQQVTRSVPGLENTYLGARLIMAGMEATFQRQIDERNYTNEFVFRNGGDTITGAKEQFNADHPIQGYIDHALAPFGIANGRIQSDDDAGWLYQNGYINKQEYRAANKDIRERGGG